MLPGVSNHNNMKKKSTDLANKPNTELLKPGQNVAGLHKQHVSDNLPDRRQVMKSLLSGGLTLLALGPIAACSSTVTQHGHLLTEADLSQVQNGMSKQQVQYLLGTPDTTATYTGDVYYYISSKMETKAFLSPKEIDRRVVAVYFAPQIDTVTRVAHYGLQDGKVIDFISRETPSHGKEASLLQQLFRNLGPSTSIFGGGE